MKKTVIILAVVLVLLVLLLKQNSQNNKPITGLYPWQVEILDSGKTRVFGIVLNESKLKKVDEILKITPVIALYEDKDKNKLSLEAYYKNVSLGGLIGSFILTLDGTDEELQTIKKESHKKEKTKNNEVKYKLDKFASAKAKDFRVKNIIYIPTVQLDEKTIVERFGQPTHKIKLKTKESGWHYLYPEKGLDLIFKEESKEVLQYVSPEQFNLLLEPLQSH